MATLLFFAIAESFLRVAYLIRNSLVTSFPLPYVVGADYGPIPPWVDGLRMIEADQTLVWKGRPGFRQRYVDGFAPMHTEDERRAMYRRFLPSLPPSLVGRPAWKISLNGEGFRDTKFPKSKPSPVFRILCLGDSWTVGSNVNEEDAFPQRLREMLRKEFPNANFEVFNMGVFGYASYNGLRLMKRAVELRPDVVVIGFAMNEARMAGARDWNPGEKNGARKYSLSTGAVRRVLREIESAASNHVEFYKLLKYYALLLKWKPKSVGEHLKMTAEASWGFRPIADNAALDPWMRKLMNDCEQNFLDMIRMAGAQNAGVILLHPEFTKDSPFLKVLEKISGEKRIPLVDSSSLIAEARRKIEEDLERRLGLRPSSAGQDRMPEEVEVIFRVHLEGRVVPRAIYIVGTHEKLGSLTPNQVAMFDDGTHGDQRAYDKVWSYSAKFERGTKLFYTYTNSGKAGRWEEIDVPALRSLVVDPVSTGTKLCAPIDTFGKMHLYADPWHTDAAGNKLIAEALLGELKKSAQVKGYLRKISDKRL